MSVARGDRDDRAMTDDDDDDDDDPDPDHEHVASTKENCVFQS